MTTLLAGGVGIAGVALIYHAWRSTNNTSLKWVGWLLVVSSAVLWTMASGMEFGSVYFIAALPISAWVFVLYHSSSRSHSTSAVKRKTLQLPTWRIARRHLGLLTLAFPISGLTSALTSFSIASLLPWSEVDRLAMVMLLMPVLWGVLMFWCCADQRTLRSAGAILGLGLISGIHQLG